MTQPSMKYTEISLFIMSQGKMKVNELCNEMGYIGACDFVGKDGYMKTWNSIQGV
jgi:hypothetical protein